MQRAGAAGALSAMGSDDARARPLTRRIGLLAACLAASLLGACAAMSVEECRSADWGEQGMRDALNGYPRARLQDIREACAEAGVVPNEALYLGGWNAGITRFCTPENGARWGRDGRAYLNSCPPQIEGGFLDRYRAGRQAYDAEQALRRLQGEQDRLQRQLGLSKDEAVRRQLRQQLRELDWRIAQARSDLDRAEWKLRLGR
ncbi:DUF2799 domain-containing protein [Comamonas sp. NLF-1-9]|uniref:DUF2799 domain-containing protein n=1 Tax=Comamonas sp. NLF-1-9 TaxID=2853163 RepID=UPI001C4402E8|nr:DUF2799 domain-containing protein [Comamonas sp. NLF-1-9]QXL83934.1 DUF2799 domain-containing protein [Comamonas sp. NLF-1-9]